MQIRQIETFLAILEAGTLTGAAATLFKTQGAVSQDLKALEAEFGVVLLDRSGQRVRLTAAGESLLPLARRLLTDVADIEVEMTRVRDGAHSTLHIGCLPSLASRVSAHVADFTRSTPDVSCTLETALHNELSIGLRTRHLDLAVYEARSDDDITTIPLESEGLHIALPGDHALTAADVVRARDLDGLPYIGLSREMGATLEAQRFFAAGGAYPTPTIEVTDVHLVLQLVERLRGFGIVPVSSLAGRPGLAGVPADPSLSRQVAIALLADRFQPRHVREFADLLTHRWDDCKL